MSEEIDLVPQSLCDSLPANVAGSLKALRDYDLSYFTEHLVDTGRMFAPEQKYPLIAHFGKADIEVCRMLEREFRKFVALTLIEPGITFAPPGPVDMYWHFMILHTKEYKQFCEKIWALSSTTREDHWQTQTRLMVSHVVLYASLGGERWRLSIMSLLTM